MALLNAFPQGAGGGLPNGGTTGQVLMKNSNTDGDVKWDEPVDLSDLPVMEGSTYYEDGEKGAVPQPLSTDTGKYLGADGHWHTLYASATTSTVIVVATNSSLIGRTATLSDGATSVTQTIDSNGEAVFTGVTMCGAVSVSATDADSNEAKASLNLTYFGTYTTNLTLNFSTLHLVSTDANMIGKTIEIYYNNTKVAETSMSSTLVADVYVEELGTYVAKVNAGARGIGQVSFTVSEMQQVYTQSIFLYHLYAWKRDKNDSNPATAVTAYESAWGCENLNFTPAHMDFTNDTWVWGSWTGTEFFFPKPCMLNYNGTVAYYLDPDDYTKKADGVTASDVGDFNFGGNAMMEFPTVYFNRWEDANTDYCVISDKKLTNDFKAYAHHDINGAVLPFIYLSIYDGSFDGTRMRSISGKPAPNQSSGPQTGRIYGRGTAQTEINHAKANNSGGSGERWYTWHKADRDLVTDLLVLVVMNDNSREAVGNGKDRGWVSDTNPGHVTTGSMNTKGMFWGENTGAAGMKCFGIENFWGNISKRTAGWINANGTQKVKMTYGTEDGSTATGFNLDGAGYVTIPNATPSGTSGNFISKWHYTSMGLVPYQASGSSSTYIPDTIYFNNSQGNYALCGGHNNANNQCGIAIVYMHNLSTLTANNRGAALSYKSLAS